MERLPAAPPSRLGSNRYLDDAVWRHAWAVPVNRWARWLQLLRRIINACSPESPA